MNMLSIGEPYMTYRELIDAMKQKKWETKYQMIPHGKKGKAQFAGYSVTCYGIFNHVWHKDSESCDFRIPMQKRVTKKMHHAILYHLHDHPFHEVHLNVGWDIPTDPDDPALKLYREKHNGNISK